MSAAQLLHAGGGALRLGAAGLRPVAEGVEERGEL